MKIFLPLFILFTTQTSYPQHIFKAKIVDTETNAPLPARIVITDDTGHVYNSYYSKLPGFFTGEDGTFQIELRSAKYSVEVFRGIDYQSKKVSIQLNSNKDTVIHLKQWYPLKKQGWYNGDGHDHLYTEKKPDTAMLALVRKICLAQGVDFMFTAQGWAGYNDSTWKEGYSKFSDENFFVSYGSEMPKYRTGHTWWLGQKSTRQLFDATMDTTYENHYYQTEQGTDWTFDRLPFPQVPDVEVVNKFKTEDKSLAIAAHPTSWWMQQRGNVEKYVTNVACNLSFGLLSGKIWDGLVVMGYDHDHYYYQNLWFNVLNQGYRVPGFSELDGGLGKDDKFYYGSMRTYFHVDGALTANKLLDAAKKGKSFHTSGPIIIAKIDNRYSIGDIIPSGNKKHVLKVEAYASGESDDYLSYVIVFRNGKIFRLWDVRNEKKKVFSASLPFIEKEPAWYIVKVYGKNAWKDTASLDVMKVCEKVNEREESKGEMDVAFTNPFYFRRNEEKDPPLLNSNVVLKLSGASNVKSGNIEVLVAGKKIKTVTLNSSSAKFSMPVNAVLKIVVKGYPVLYRSLYLDYLPHRNILEELASGRWRKKYEPGKFTAGEVPWKAFNFEKTRKILTRVKWEIVLNENERDRLYSSFFEATR